jgi:hypothetical protein
MWNWLKWWKEWILYMIEDDGFYMWVGGELKEGKEKNDKEKRVNCNKIND